MKIEEYKIESNIPIPQYHQSAKYPFRMLEVGQSFYAGNIIPHRMQTRLVYWEKKLGISLIARKENTGVRVWRTK